MVSHMYDQCSHCFRMYHVNINTLYQKKKKNDINFVKENKLFTPKI